MRLFNCIIKRLTYYPFGNSMGDTSKRLICVDNDSLSKDDIKAKVIKSLGWTDQYKEVAGHTYVTDIKLEKVLNIS